MSLLDVREIDVHYDTIRAIQAVSFSVNHGEIVALIGANGAGKSTTLNAISGLTALSAGRIIFDDEDLGTLSPHEIVLRGVIQVPEGRRIFGRLTVRENLEVGAFTRKDGARAIAADVDRWFELFPRLKERVKQVAGTLSGGEQQMLSIARGMMARPRVLLLDEPSMGIAPILVDQIFEALRSINEQGTTIILVEQNAAIALDLCDRAYVLESGSMVLQGKGQDLLGNDAVARAYLG